MEVAEFIVQCYLQAAARIRRRAIAAAANSGNQAVSMATELVSSSIMVVCSCREPSALNQVLFSRGVLSRAVKVPAPDALARAEIFSFHASLLFPAASPESWSHVSAVVSKETDGKSAVRSILLFPPFVHEEKLRP
jgi:hypothetical protein